MERFVWFDALTPKQLLIAESLRRSLAGRGYRVVISSRRYDAIEGLCRALGIDALLVGSHGGDPLEKLRLEIDRMGLLLQRLGDLLERFFAGISYPNPAEARILFGLSKPYVVLSDTPHAFHAHRLSVPLAHVLVFSRCIPSGEWRPYTLPGTRLVPYHGVDELSWIRGLPEALSEAHVKALGLESRGYIVLRPEEARASYYSWEGRERLWERLVEWAVSRKIKTVYLPRYSYQRAWAEGRFSREVERGDLVIPSGEKAVGPAIAGHALAVVTGGGTMAREAALQGVAGINLFPLELHVDRCLSSAGIPIYRADGVEDVIGILEKASRDPDKMARDVESLLRDMEAPQEVLARVLQDLGGDPWG